MFPVPPLTIQPGNCRAQGPQHFVSPQSVLGDFHALTLQNCLTFRNQVSTLQARDLFQILDFVPRKCAIQHCTLPADFGTGLYM